VEALAQAGRLAGRDLDWPTASAMLARAVKQAPERVDLLRGLATAQLYNNQIDDTYETTKKLQALQPSDPTVARYLSLTLVGKHQWIEARPYAQKALEAAPEDREANLTMAVVAFNLNDIDEAKKRVETCLAKDNSDPGALFYLGLIHKTEGDPSSAIQAL